MEASDTEIKITAENLRKYMSIDKYNVGDYDAPIEIKEEVWDINQIIKDQAKISFNAGIKEVVDFVNLNMSLFSDLPSWKDKLKEWGVE